VPKPTIDKIKTIKNLKKRSNLPIILVTETLSKEITMGIKTAAHLKKTNRSTKAHKCCESGPLQV